MPPQNLVGAPNVATEFYPRIVLGLAKKFSLHSDPKATRLWVGGRQDVRPSDALGTSWLNFRQLLKVYLPRRDEKAGILSPCLCLARFVSCSFSSLPFPLSPEHYCIASVFAVTNVGQHKSVCSLFSAQSRCSLLCLKIDSSGIYMSKPGWVSSSNWNISGSYCQTPLQVLGFSQRMRSCI